MRRSDLTRQRRTWRDGGDDEPGPEADPVRLRPGYHPAMLRPGSSALTNTMTLDEVLRRLAQHELVDGVLLLGSTGTDTLTPTSDYDLLLVLAHAPAPLRMITTWVDRRLTEVYCTTVPAIERVTADLSRWPAASEEATLVTWLREGRLVHDRTGQLVAVQERVRGVPPALPGERAIEEAWREIGYNAAQLRRYLADNEPTTQVATDLRLLYSLYEVATGYFTVRRLPWRGEKAAVRYWLTQDPEYLDVLSQCLVEPDRRRKADLYEDLARRTLAPVGGLWASGATVVASGSPWGEGTEEALAGATADACALWDRLTGATLTVLAKP